MASPHLDSKVLPQVGPSRRTHPGDQLKGSLPGAPFREFPSTESPQEFTDLVLSSGSHAGVPQRSSTRGGTPVVFPKGRLARGVPRWGSTRRGPQREVTAMAVSQEGRSGGVTQGLPGWSTGETRKGVPPSGVPRGGSTWGNQRVLPQGFRKKGSTRSSPQASPPGDSPGLSQNGIPRCLPHMGSHRSLQWYSPRRITVRVPEVDPKGAVPQGVPNSGLPKRVPHGV
jgi:hypothetical protein